MSEAAGMGRLAGWLVLVAGLAALNYSARAAGGDPPEDVLYEYETAIAGVIQFGLIFAFLLLIAHGGPVRELFALRRPISWKRAALISLAVFVLMLVLSAMLSPFLDAGEEQGLAPDEWDRRRVEGLAANAVVVVALAPIVEELCYRGLGYSLLARFGDRVAIVVVGLAFGLGHGLIIALPILTAFGIGLAYLRSRTRSVYPSIALHAFFNAFSLAVGLAV